jgi:hypothetical protein
VTGRLGQSALRSPGFDDAIRVPASDDISDNESPTRLTIHIALETIAARLYFSSTQYVPASTSGQLHPSVESCESKYHKRAAQNAPASNDHIPRLTMPYLQCCCGKLDCAYLEHNNVALSGLEKDIETAAQVGQVRVNTPISHPLLLHMDAANNPQPSKLPR